MLGGRSRTGRGGLWRGSLGPSGHRGIRAVVQHDIGAQGDGAWEAERGEGNVHAGVTLSGEGRLPARRGGGLEGVAARVRVGGCWRGARRAYRPGTVQTGVSAH